MPIEITTVPEREGSSPVDESGVELAVIEEDIRIIEFVVEALFKPALAQQDVLQILIPCQDDNGRFYPLARVLSYPSGLILRHVNALAVDVALKMESACRLPASQGTFKDVLGNHAAFAPSYKWQNTDCVC